jgi:hypothetical protein
LINRVSTQTYKDIHSFFENEHRKLHEVVDFSEVSLHMSKKMKIIPKIQAIVFGRCIDDEINHIINDHGQAAVYTQIKEFNRVKRVLKNCVVPHGSK